MEYKNRYGIMYRIFNKTSDQLLAITPLGVIKEKRLRISLNKYDRSKEISILESE